MPNYQGVWSLSTQFQNASGWPKTAGGIISTATLHLDAGDSSSYSGSGGTWYDLSGNGLNAVATSPSYSASDGGGSFGFSDSTTDDFSVANTGAVLSYGSGDFTFLMWVKPEVPVGYDLYAGQKGTERWYLSTGQDTLSFETGTGPNFSWDNTGARKDTTSDTSSTGALAESQWQMIVARYRNGVSQDFITGAGVLKASVAPSSGSMDFASTVPLTIGMEAAGDYDAVGRVAVVLLWKRSLSLSEIAAVHSYYSGRF